MSEKITNTFTFYGNAQIKGLESELIERFQKDRASGHNEMTAVKRLLFGLAEEAPFEYFERIGSHWAWYFGSELKFELESKQCALEELQDYITACAATLDPDVIVQMDYIGNTPEIVGTRFTCLDSEGGLVSEYAKEELNCLFCDEDDIEELLENKGNSDVTVMSYQELDELVLNLKESALHDFNAASNRIPVVLAKS
jgi:hypothetical protein